MSTFGSLQNHIQGNGKAEFKAPAVGDGATRISYSDRDPYTVVRVNASGKTCWVKADNYTRTDSNGMTDSGQTYTYTANPDASEVKVKWTGKRWLGGGSTYIIGRREKYHDFSF